MSKYFEDLINSWKSSAVQGDITECSILDHIMNFAIESATDNATSWDSDEEPDEDELEEARDYFDDQLQEEDYRTWLVEMNEKEKSHYGKGSTHWLIVKSMCDEEIGISVWITNEDGDMLTEDEEIGDCFHRSDIQEVNRIINKALNNLMLENPTDEELDAFGDPKDKEKEE